MHKPRFQAQHNLPTDPKPYNINYMPHNLPQNSIKTQQRPKTTKRSIKTYKYQYLNQAILTKIITQSLLSINLNFINIHVQHRALIVNAQENKIYRAYNISNTDRTNKNACNKTNRKKKSRAYSQGATKDGKEDLRAKRK